MAASPATEFRVRITVHRPPGGVRWAVQRGRDELLEPSVRTPTRLVFDFDIRVGDAATGAAPRLLGPYTQGPPSGRFVYVNSGAIAGQLDTPWQRRAKIPLAGITTAMIREVARTPAARIETEFEGTGKDGGPTCATVKGIAWRVAGE